MLKVLQKLLIITLLVLLGMFLLYEGLLYYQARDKMPVGMTVAGLDVGGLTLQEVSDLVIATYEAPVIVHHRVESIEIAPADVGFVLHLDSMLQEAEAFSKPEEAWMGFLEFILDRSFEPVEIELQATLDQQALAAYLKMLAELMDQPATAPRLDEETETYMMGNPGFITDIEASLPTVEAAFYDVKNREAQLTVLDQEAEPFDINILKNSIERQVQGFDGLGSFFIMDLETGDELGINADVALSGLSVVKIAILLETYRVLDNPPTADQAKLIVETAINSGNYSANLLLDIVAGQDNAYLGVDLLTESMHRLGLENTFIITPYEEPDRPGKNTLGTPANSRTDLTTNPDPTMQTTAEDMGTLLSMIYYCSQGGGTLLAVYPDQLTPSECQEIIDVLSQNTEGNLIRFGVPEGIRVSHKHGWAGNTHGDAGIIFSPAGDYIIVEYLTQPWTDWLVHDISFPILREISRETYNYFNYENPFFGDGLERAPDQEPPPGPEEGEPGTTPEDDGEFPKGIEAFQNSVEA